MRVELADSLTSGKISESLNNQLRQKYSNSTEHLSVFVIPVDQQNNSIDCGLYAIANAVEFLSEGGNPEALYNPDEMRSHFIQCLESGEIRPFPKNPKKRRGRKAKTLEIVI